MQQCPNCGSVYDESDYTHCPYCKTRKRGRGYGSLESKIFLYDKEKERNRWVSESECDFDPDRYEAPH